MKTNHLQKVAKVILGSLMILTLFSVNIPGQDSLRNGLVAYWSFDEGQGLTVMDLSGYGNNGLLHSGVTWTNGRFGKALLFNGNPDSFVQVASSPSLNVSTGLTISAWIWTPDATHGIIVAKWNDIQQDWSYIFKRHGQPHSPPHLSIELSRSVFVDLARADSSLTPLGEWVHVATSYDANTRAVRLFINGALDVTGVSSGGNIDASLCDLILGGANPGQEIPGGAIEVFKGLMDDIRIYNRALSEAEVRVLFEMDPSGPPKFYTSMLQMTNFTGKSLSVPVDAYGSLPLTYQWQFNGNNLADATNATLQLTNLALADSGTYSLTVSNAYGVTNKDLLVLSVVDSPPFLVRQPQDQWKQIGTDVAFEVQADGSWPMYYQWQHDGEAIAGATNPVYLFVFSNTNQIGGYAVIVTNALGSVTSSVANLTLRLPMLVWTDSPNPMPPFQTWETAAHTIQDAADAALAGETVLVTNGVYDTGGRDGNRVMVPNRVTLQSVNGPEVTTIHGMGEVRCVYLGASAVLSGFTLTNGWTGYYHGQGGGVSSASTNPVVTNCIITGNSAGEGSGGGASGGTLYNCTLIGNYALTGGGASQSTLINCLLKTNRAIGSSEWGGDAGSGGGVYECLLYKCVLIGNHAGVPYYFRARTGGGGSYSTFNNCTLIGNSAFWSGGGAHYSTLNNCTLTGNRASQGGGSYGSTLKNCIVYGNFGGGNYDGGILDYSCTFPMPINGVGNITNAPIFVNAAAGDYRLAFGSPGIDAGTNLSAIITNDLPGNLRPLDGNGDGVAAFDMGAYEFDWRTAVPADWLAGKGLATNDYATLTQDHDGDGISTYLEYVAGTCPTNADSCFHITAAGATATNTVVVLEVLTASNRVYSLEFCTDLNFRDWQPVEGQTDIPGNGGVMMFMDPNAVPPRFYRITVRFP